MTTLRLILLLCAISYASPILAGGQASKFSSSPPGSEKTICFPEFGMGYASPEDRDAGIAAAQNHKLHPSASSVGTLVWFHKSTNPHMATITRIADNVYITCRHVTHHFELSLGDFMVGNTLSDLKAFIFFGDDKPLAMDSETIKAISYPGAPDVGLIYLRPLSGSYPDCPVLKLPNIAMTGPKTFDVISWLLPDEEPAPVSFRRGISEVSLHSDPQNPLHLTQAHTATMRIDNLLELDFKAMMSTSAEIRVPPSEDACPWLLSAERSPRAFLASGCSGSLAFDRDTQTVQGLQFTIDYHFDRPKIREFILRMPGLLDKISKVFTLSAAAFKEKYIEGSVEFPIARWPIEQRSQLKKLLEEIGVHELPVLFTTLFIDLGPLHPWLMDAISKLEDHGNQLEAKLREIEASTLDAWVVVDSAGAVKP